MSRMFIESEGGVGFKRGGRRKRKEVCRLLKEETSRSCRFACVAFNVYRYMFGRVLNRGFVNPRVQCRRDSLHETFLNSLNKSEGSQRASRGGESLVVRVNVNGYRSILNTSDAGIEAETLFNSLNRSKGFQRALCEGESLIVRVNGYRSILDAYDTGKEAI
jgi:hypothetical protein